MHSGEPDGAKLLVAIGSSVHGVGSALSRSGLGALQHLSGSDVGVVVGSCALAAVLSRRLVAVFNDGLRPSLFNVVPGDHSQRDLVKTAVSISAPFVLGLGIAMALLSGTVNPFLLFLPTDVIGMWSSRTWIASVLGAAWGLLVVVVVSGADHGIEHLPIPFLGVTATVMSITIVYMFPLFPAIASAQQLGQWWGAGAVLVTGVVLATTRRFLSGGAFPGAIATAAGFLLFLAGITIRSVRVRRTASDRETTPNSSESPIEAMFTRNERRIRHALFPLMLMGAAIATLANLRIFAGGEVTGFFVRQGNMGGAAQIDAYRALSYVPMMATTAAASGVYGLAGLLLVYPVGYLCPDPVVAALAGAMTYFIEVQLLSWIRRFVSTFGPARDAADSIRSAIYVTFETALLVGAVIVGFRAAGGVGLSIVSGIYLLNEALGRPVIRMAAAPLAVLLGGLLLNALYGLDLLPR